VGGKSQSRKQKSIRSYPRVRQRSRIAAWLFETLTSAQRQPQTAEAETHSWQSSARQSAARSAFHARLSSLTQALEQTSEAQSSLARQLATFPVNST